MEAIASAYDLTAIRGLEQDEIQDAVEELKRSTAAIEKQTESLRLQQNAMNTLIKNKSRNDQARIQSEKSQLRKWSTEKDQAVSSVSYAPRRDLVSYNSISAGSSDLGYLNHEILSFAQLSFFWFLALIKTG